MRKFIIIALILPLLVLIAQPSISAKEYAPLLKVTVRDIYLTAGEENEIEVELRNMGSFSVFEVEAILTPTTQGIVVLEKGHMIFNEIEGGKSKRYRPTLYVDENIPLGPYQLSLALTYRQMYKWRRAYTRTTTLHIGVVVVNVTKPEIGLGFQLTDQHLTTGEEKEIHLEVWNRGAETLRDIEIAITSNTPHIAVMSSTINIDKLEPQRVERLTITLAVSNSATLGVYTLTAATTYMDERGEIHTEVETLGLSVDEVKIERTTTLLLESYTLSREEPKPGEPVKIVLHIRCVRAEAYDVKVSLSPDPMGGLSLTTPSLLYLGDLGLGESAEASYRLMIDGDAKSGQYSLTVQITYLDFKGLPGRTVETITVTVSPMVEFRILLEGDLRGIKGEFSTLSGDLLLIATESVRFVEVEVVEDDFFRRSIGSEEYIGNLDPDSPLPFDLRFIISQDAEEGLQMLRVRVSYLDHLNRRRSRILSIPIYVETPLKVETVRKERDLWHWIRWLLGILPRWKG